MDDGQHKDSLAHARTKVSPGERGRAGAIVGRGVRSNQGKGHDLLAVEADPVLATDKGVVLGQPARVGEPANGFKCAGEVGEADERALGDPLDDNALDRRANHGKPPQFQLPRLAPHAQCSAACAGEPVRMPHGVAAKRT